MMTEMEAWIIFATVLGGAVGFYSCALCASRRIREERRTMWREGYAACNRDHQAKRKV